MARYDIINFLPIASGSKNFFTPGGWFTAHCVFMSIHEST